MKTWTKVAIFVVVVAAVIAWYIFRPERLWVNRQVDEAMPSAQGSSSLQPLESGQFYSILHPTEGTATIYQMSDGTHVLRFTSFRTSNGPDVHVYMVAADDAKDNGLIWERSRETSATKTTLLAAIWTSGNTAPCRYGANDSV